ncbi:MAG TPA: 2-oxo-tetronate isomerase [Burkholderiales bacterium]|nr:2-oxo-tetronate isomerase [Burkholderiales bacterium]
MPRFCANLSLLFTEYAFLDRFQAAADAGFSAVEYQFPYAYEANEIAARARGAGVEVVMFNLPGGNREKGELGIACLPDRTEEFHTGVARGIEYAAAANCKRLNLLAGIPAPGQADALTRATLVANLRYAAEELREAGMTLLVEAINTRTIPGFYLSRSAQVLGLIDEAGVTNAKLQYDVFHMQIMEGDLTERTEAILPRIGHIQVADVPDRREPGTGEINFPRLFEHLDHIGYEGWVGAEYFPRAGTLDGLGWVRPYLRHARATGLLKGRAA